MYSKQRCSACRTLNPPVGPLERLCYKVALILFQRLGAGELQQVLRWSVLRLLHDRARLEAIQQSQLGSLSDNRRALDDVSQLADISRPGVILESIHRLLRN